MNGVKLSPDTARRMKAFFDRHELDKKGATWDEQGKGWQAWQLWGGDPGVRWALTVMRREAPALYEAFVETRTGRKLREQFTSSGER